MERVDAQAFPDAQVPTVGGWHAVGPVLVHTDEEHPYRTTTAGYSRWDDGAGAGACAGAGTSGVGHAEVRVGGGVVRVEDRWEWDAPVLRLHREVEVLEDGEGGFCTEARLARAGSERVAGGARTFVPGTHYGDPARSNPAAIGGLLAREEGHVAFLVREDRLPAPTAALRLPDGSSLAVLDAAPDGRTTIEDARDTAVVDLVDADLRFASLHVDDGEHPHLGFVHPGLEGPTTYTGDTFPDGQLRRWRRRFHPLRAGHRTSYTVAWRVVDEPRTFREVVRDTWRWAWSALEPLVRHHDVPAARVALLDQLADSVLEVDGRAGFPHFRDAVTGGPVHPPHRQADHALMGFTGRSTDCAYYLLRESARTDDPVRAERYRRVAVAVLDSFVRLPVDPPVGEGFDIRTGEPVPAAPHQGRADVVLLRGLTEGAKTVLRASREAERQGAPRPDWRAWGLALTDWVAAQQRPDGSIPRSWLLGTSTVADPSGYSTYNAVAMLVEAHLLTGEDRHREAAERAGEASWRSEQADGVFVGGTLDNPDVIDKEAGTLSLEAYLALHELTGRPEWLERAVAAAEFAETWVYAWDVPMPYGDDLGRGWKHGTTTVGAQLIASGHSLVDQYMAFDVGSYHRLHRLTGDDHFGQVAQVLLHNTKGMVSLPEHPHDLAGPGWQQEHWSFAPPRGEGLHRGWLPWVTCSHIEGITYLD